VHQDFFWFAALCLWIAAVLAWRRHPERLQAWNWVPGAGVAGLGTAIAQLLMFNPTFDMFQDRLIPGSVANYRPAAIDPHAFTDALMAAVAVAGVALWAGEWLGRVRSAAWRWAVWPIAVAVLAIQVADGVQGAWVIAAATLGAAIKFWPATKGNWMARVGLVAAAAGPFCSTIGPLAVEIGLAQRVGPPTPMGLAMAAASGLLGALVLGGLLRGMWRRQPPETAGALRQDLRWAVVAAVVWIATGVVVALRVGADNRGEVQENRLRAAAAQAKVFNPELLAPLKDPSFRIEIRSGVGEPIAAHAPWLRGNKLEAAQRRLAQVMIATPFLESARILVVHEGWLAAVATSDRLAGDGQVELLRRATPDDLHRWTNPHPYVEESPVHEMGYPYYCRVPILAEDGKMLGWLDCVRREYFLSVERRWRAAPFLVTALGIGLLGLLVVQRQSNRESISAQRAAAEAEAGNRIKSVFLANVSHELRTPLQNILGYGELLGREPAPEERRGHLAALRGQAELMLRLVNDLIDLSAVDAGAFQLAESTVALEPLVRDTAESLRPRAAAKGLDLTCALEPGLPPWVSVDGARVRQVLLNLLGNAVKFTDRGRVSVRLSGLAAADGGWRLRLEVEDTGPGIPPEQQARLFQAFSRLEQTAGKEGTGLGLAIAARLCAAMGGGLRVESDGRSGSRFIAEFLARVAAEPAREAATFVPPSVVPVERPSVLIAEDNTLMRDLFIRGLSERGASCRAVGDAAAALAAMAEGAPHVLVLDLGLGNADGLSLLPQVRALAPECRVVVVSAHAGVAERERVRAAGVEAFLTKPVALDTLWTAVSGRREPAPAELPDYFAQSPALAAEARRVFVAELPAWTEIVEAAQRRGDLVTVRRQAHYLRSSALAVRATEVFHAAADLERVAAAGDLGAAEPAWRRCQSALRDWAAET
jgi:signal transduction histidine kinase/ActR/RegA family two-component response regulator